MNYPILPMMNFNISQGRNGSYSHKNLNAYDLCGEGTSKEYFRAPCKMKLVKKYPYIKYGSPGNTLLYQSVEKVDMANGTCDYITLALTHCDNISRWTEGQIFNQWDVIYQEGTTGNATGAHVHMEIGLGKQTYKSYDKYGNWCLKNLLNIEDVFYYDSKKIKILNNGGYRFKPLPMVATKISNDEIVTVSNGTFTQKCKVVSIMDDYITLVIDNAN